ncbi:MAG: hypothetical protein SF339_25580 [Blastocatellia bacterium]|nr:hypothetical protein [Blastocatellia bacterium]
MIGRRSSVFGCRLDSVAGKACLSNRESDAGKPTTDNRQPTTDYV